jgi:PiT family inorganic phosphate transporter
VVTIHKKVMGIIAAAVAVYINANPGVQMESWLDVVLPSDSGAFKMPTWIPLACYSAIAAGTLSGGWKIVKQWVLKLRK